MGEKFQSLGLDPLVIPMVDYFNKIWIEDMYVLPGTQQNLYVYVLGTV